MAHDVFISYSTKNTAAAEQVCSALEAAEIRCWIAPRDVPAGANWGGVINRAIKECQVFLLLVSDVSNGSDQVLKEVVIADREKKKLIPFFIEAVTLSDDLDYYLPSKQWLMGYPPPLEIHLSQLITGTRALLQDAPVSIQKPSTPTIEFAPPSEPVTGATRVREKDGMIEVFIPAGEFLMGSDEGAVDEKPPHTVHLDAYWIDQTPITNAMFAQFLNERGNRKQNSVNWYVLLRGRIRQTGKVWRVEKDFELHPVVNVNWYGARAYCEWAGAHLPTEAQWEKAARGTDGRTYPWGSREPDESLVNFNKNIRTTTPVGNYPAGASPYGVLDMAGNVWEWCADWYGKAYYRVSPTANPTGPRGGTDRVVRGGSWRDSAIWLRAACRGGGRMSSRTNYSGFRCARSV